ncbi:uncharacterized protein GGS22DRAFT_99870 [Annulohypoxylon maeteangense]|uniref:uncharacterized protein n=1 Tax=Annulohypoxylon maeteangense TaxID=1927788 RepID=UPI0020077C92|nr:uncharacterized protein GGS22DRAFT_99870 [Annulohypoxylon maeteangense]KAI0880107.1 hypothetical protein GGS22DRAFT_99870 [Annulohypoxylon maeteangense]
MNPPSHSQTPRRPPSSGTSRQKSNPQTPKPGKTIPAPAPKLSTQRGRNPSSYNTIPQHQHHARPLEPASILSNPRLRQVTGMHPRKACWWNGMHLPKDELIRLQWAMTLPDVYPAKRPKGNF